MKKVGITRFPGTNCDYDVWQAVEAAGLKPEWLWHQDRFNAVDYVSIILPGGFSYGDYLRVGALAAKAPVMSSVIDANKRGVPILGICNGFQILCDANLLPGALIRNVGLRFIDRWVELNHINSHNVFTKNSKPSLRLPIAHGDGRYYIPEEQLKSLEDDDQIWFTYKDNPNGSVSNIAGIMNKQKNVAGLMPHPERAIYDWMGSSDGFSFFQSMA